MSAPALGVRITLQPRADIATEYANSCDWRHTFMLMRPSPYYSSALRRIPACRFTTQRASNTQHCCRFICCSVNERQQRSIWFKIRCAYRVYDAYGVGRFHWPHLAIKRRKRPRYTNATIVMTLWRSQKSCRPKCIEIKPFSTNVHLSYAI